jgi:integrase
MAAPVTHHASWFLGAVGDVEESGVGVSVIRLHDLRHTHATLLLENGESLQYVAERLGVHVETVIEVYAHVTSKMRAVAPSRLAAMIDAPGIPPISQARVDSAPP